VPQEKQTEIFEEFVQADSSHARRFEGSGLGLAISRRLVEAMGGEIGMSDAGAQGSIFWVRLPLTETARIGTFVLEGRRIAIVSRSELVRRSLRAQIEAAGAECVAAIEVAALSGPCDLVIVDPAFGDSIPDMRSTGVPALALLPPEHRATLSSLRDRGIDGYLTKPLRQSSLEERVLAVLSGNDCKESVIVEPQQGQPGKRGLAVLLAEDNPVNALLARELLRRRGHDVTAVTTGDAAVRACAEHRFDLVIMDLHMPGLDGIEATRQIRAAERSQGKASVPIFALTADALETGRRACQEAGMDGFLTKPVDPADLDAFLAAVSGARAAA
jgi:CheY-like chemotaxis protein